MQPLKVKIQDVEFLATLPTYEEAIARLMGTMKEAAAGKLVRTLAALRDKLQAEAANFKPFLTSFNLLILGIDCYVIN